MKDENFTLHQDDFDRIILWCNVCLEHMVVEDVLTFRMKSSQVFGRLRATVYSLHNVLRMSTFVRGHQHKEEE